MPTRTLVCRALLLIVFSACIGCAGGVFGAEVKAGDNITITITNTTPEAQAQAPEKAKTAAADVPRELAMRPLPAYRIQPPDIIQIEIITAKDGKSGVSQPSSGSEQGSVSSGSGTVSDNDSQTKPGAATVTINAVAVPSADDTNVGGGPTNITAGTLTLSGSGSVNNYSGTTAIVGDSGIMTKTGTGKVTFYKADNVTANDWTPATQTNTGTLIVSGSPIATGDTNTGRIYLSTNPAAVTGTGVFVQSNTGGPPEVRNPQRTNRRISAARLVAGQYLVGPDGTINLRQYGMVQVMGMTIAEANAALEKHLAKYFDSVEVSVNVLGYNHQVYYIITDGSGMGDNVRRIPITGYETVLDAVAAVGGRSQFSGKKMWIARPSATNSENGTILPVDYDAIIRRGATATNYQVMPGDRIFIEGDKAIALNSSLSKRTAPVERVMGLISLGAATIQQIEKILPKESEEQ